MAIQIASLFASIGADPSGLQKGLSDAEGAIRKSAQSMEKSGGSFNFTSLMVGLNQALELAGKFSQTMQKVIEFSKEGAQIQRLADTSSALARSMGMDMGDIVQSVRSASLGMVSEYEIMQASSRALMLGVGGSAEQLGQLMEVAAIRGRAMGLSTTQAFNDIITGIGRMSPQILDNLGIITDAEVTYSAYALSLGKTAAQLTATEKKQALLNRVIDDSKTLLTETGGLTLDAAGHWEVMEAAQADFFASLKTDASELMTWWPQFWAGVYKAMTPPSEQNLELVDAMPILNDYLIDGRITLDQYNEALGYVNNGLMTGAEAVKYAQKNFLSFYETNDDLITQLFDQSTSWDGFVQSMNDAGLDIGMLTEDIWAAEKALSGMGYTAENVTESIPKAMRLAGLAVEDFQGRLSDAQFNLSVAVQTFYESVGDNLVEGLRDAGLKGDDLISRLEILDGLMGTSYTLEYKIELATGDLLDQLINDPDGFAEAFAMFDEEYTLQIAGIAEAQAEVDTLQGALDDIEKTYNVWVNIHTRGSIPSFGGGYSPVTETGHAMGGYELAGQPYLVGEAGPELYIPDTNGRVYSNASSGAMMGGGNGDLLAALLRLPTASDFALAVRDALLMMGA